MRARARFRREEHEQDYPENEKGGIYTCIYIREPGACEMRRTSFRASKGNHPRLPSLLFDRACIPYTGISVICYNNNDNCDERQIAETTITLLNRDVSRLLEIHSGQLTGGG